MEDKYQHYCEYNESGIPWMGAVPTHWDQLKLKFLFSEKKKNTNPLLPSGSISFGVVVYKNEDNLATETKDSYREVLKNEFLVNPLNLNYDLKSLRTALSDKNVVVSSGYIVIKSSGLIDKHFARWLLHQFDVSHMKTLGSGVRQTLTYTDISNCYVRFPSSIDEQKAIGNFINQETSKIDELIAKQEMLIRLLEEKRQAVISHAVTKGLNADVLMKDSGIEWFGEVPEHWNICSLRRLIRKMEQGKSPECDNQPAVGEEWGVLKTSCVNNGLFVDSENKRLPKKIEPHYKYAVRKGDLLMSRASGSPKLIGSVAHVTSTANKRLLSDKIFRIYLHSHLVSEFFYWMMRADYIREQIMQSISGAEGMANNITKQSILNFYTALPPSKEQMTIVKSIEEDNAKISSLIEKAKDQLKLLSERKSALISSAVTGKIDVRQYKSLRKEQRYA